MAVVVLCDPLWAPFVIFLTFSRKNPNSLGVQVIYKSLSGINKNISSNQTRWGMEDEVRLQAGTFNSCWDPNWVLGFCQTFGTWRVWGLLLMSLWCQIFSCFNHICISCIIAADSGASGQQKSPDMCPDHPGLREMQKLTFQSTLMTPFRASKNNKNHPPPKTTKTKTQKKPTEKTCKMSPLRAGFGKVKLLMM